jgi:hypothetical protein
MAEADTSASDAVTSAIANASVNAIGGIPSDKLNEILLNEEYMKRLRPLIAKAVKQASSIQGLRDAITKLFENETNKNTELSEALTALQNELQSIYLAKSQEKRTSYGGKRRKSKKRNYYKKRRTSKYR